jgi:hypothetical protein
MIQIGIYVVVLLYNLKGQIMHAVELQHMIQVYTYMSCGTNVR